jgi:ribosome-associated toxin RatA of RatAB toxin-antitoxin module
VLAGLVVYVRGTWADSEPRDPASVDARPVCQIYQPPDGPKRVRCAILLPYPRRRVWQALTDYAHYADFLPYLADTTAERTDEGEMRMTGQAKSALSGYWPFAITVHEEKTPDAWRAWWDEPSPPVLVNRGGWTLRAHDQETTLLVLDLETEVKGYPTFFLRAVFRHRLPHVLRAVQRHLAGEPAER